MNEAELLRLAHDAPSDDELFAAAVERVNEAGLAAEELYERLLALPRDEAVDLLRAQLQMLAAREYQVWAMRQAEQLASEVGRGE